MATVWKGTINFGLVAFPVQLRTAARERTVNFNLLHKADHSRVKQLLVCSKDNQPLDRASDLVKGYEYEKGQYVVVEEEDFLKVAPKSSRTMEILEFVEAAQVDPIYLEKSYWIEAGKGGEKPYALLFRALRESGLYGIAKVSLYKREHIAILRPNGRGIGLHTMFFEEEIRADEQYDADSNLVSEKELAMAKLLVDQLRAEFEPAKYRDEYREAIHAMIDQKRAGQEIVAAAEPERMAPVIDILEALKASIAKKPVAKAVTAEKKARKAR